MPTVARYPTADEVAQAGADLVADVVRAHPNARLMLPTGSTPKAMYAQLRTMHATGQLVGGDVTLLQLDEYVGLSGTDLRAYRRYLRSELGQVFPAQVGIAADSEDLEAVCFRHQQALAAAPVDLAVIGIGQNGHVAFNEPGSDATSTVRVVTLANSTRQAAAPDFPEGVPEQAVTVGIADIMTCRRLLLVATGATKDQALAGALRGPVGPHNPASLLRDHPNLLVIADAAAARLLP